MLERSDCAGLAAGNGGHLIDGEALDEAKMDHLPLLGGEERKRLERERECGWRSFDGEVAAVGQPLLAPALTQPVDAPQPGDSDESGEERPASLAVAPNALECFKKDLAGDVFGGCPVACPGIDIAKDDGMIAFEGHRPCRGITGA